MKKIAMVGLLPVALMAGSTVCFANGFDGMYAGASLGSAVRIGTGNTASTFNTTSGTQALTVNSNLAFDLRKNSFFGVIAGGYGFDFCDYYLGAEAFVNGSRYKRESPVEGANITSVAGSPVVTTTSGFSNVVSTKLRSVEYGIDLRPGYVFCCDTMLYGRIGVAFNRLTLTSTSGFNSLFASAATFQTFPFSGTSGGPTASKVKNIGALRLGLGLERKFGNCLAVRADYVYTRYSSVSVASSSVTSSAAPAVTNNGNNMTTVKLSGYVGMLGVYYYF